METADIKIIIAEAVSRCALEALENYCIYGDETHEFKFKVYSPMRLKDYPDRYFFYASYSQRELDELYEKVDMTYRVEPVDYLEYHLRGSSFRYRTFTASDQVTLAKMGQPEFYHFLPRRLKNKLLSSPEELVRPFVLDEIFGKEEATKKTKNVILIFCNEECMLSFLNLLLHPGGRFIDSIRVGKMNDTISGRDHWALAIRGVADEPERIRENMVYGDRDFEQIEHTDHIPAERHGFVEVGNEYAKQAFEHYRRLNQPQAA